jgi:alanine racemase
MSFLAHTANSGAILSLPESHLDMVRPGLILYGAYPSSNVSRTFPLVPAGSLKSRITFLKAAPPGRTISYGRTYTTTRATTIATVPVGYADGCARGFSNRGHVLIRGERRPIVGRVCMDQCLVNVDGIDDIQLGEEVTFFGRSSEGATLPVEEVAETIGTIPNEILCAVTQRVPRVYIG